ncbi:hypothetical protein Tco_0064815 [Tanacetum coccineum]
MLTKQLESYKEKVWVFEMTKENNTTYFNVYVEADIKAKRFEQESQSQFIHDRDVIRDLEQQRDKLDLSVVELKRQIMELQKTQTILKQRMSENEDKYHDTNSKLYDASCLDDLKIQMNVRDTKDILDDATKSQIKIKRKSQDPIAIEKKQNVWTIEYKKLNVLYEDFVPQKELSAEQKYFSSSFISYENSSNASSPYSSFETKPTVTPMASANPMLVDVNKMEIMEKLESESMALEFQVQSLIKKRENVKTEYQKLFDSIKRKRTQTQGEINELIENVIQMTYANADVHAQNQDLLITISELKAKLKNIEKGMRAISSVRRLSNRDSSFKNSVLSNTKNLSEKVEVSDRSNKKSNVSSKNVDSNKKIITNDDIKIALIAKNVLCVSCVKNVLIPCHDNCLAKYKSNVHSKVRKALFTTHRTVKSQFKDTTPVVLKTRFFVKTIQSKSLDTTLVVSKTKIVVVTFLSAKHKVVQIILWIVDNGFSKHMMGDRSLLKNFIEKFMGTVRFGNDHFAAIIGYGDYVQGNITVCHVYYLEGI